jgi:hypothetical protein
MITFSTVKITLLVSFLTMSKFIDDLIFTIMSPIAFDSF